ncbi:cytidine deaminase [Aeromicrobium sp. NPDC092404]|uniref:cytidine deaminase n=1 Tax=Aeromicrobium sp. NPDC092404 TaxID=3154976 RepID=UPI00344AF02E
MELSPEDAKLVTLARASRARTGAAEGAAVRDLDGRTYAASTVALESLRVAALDLAVAMAVSSGAKGLEGAAVVTESASVETTAVRDLAGDGVSVFVADASGTVGSEVVA